MSSGFESILLTLGLIIVRFLQERTVQDRELPAVVRGDDNALAGRHVLEPGDPNGGLVPVCARSAFSGNRGPRRNTPQQSPADTQIREHVADRNDAPDLRRCLRAFWRDGPASGGPAG